MLTRKPKIGDKIRFPYWKPGRVASVIEVKDNGICWIQVEGFEPNSFIYQFGDGSLNKLAELVE